MSAKSLEKRIYDIVHRNRSCYMDSARVRDTAADIMKEIEAETARWQPVIPAPKPVPECNSPEWRKLMMEVQKMLDEREYKAAKEFPTTTFDPRASCGARHDPVTGRMVRTPPLASLMGDDALNIDPAVLREHSILHETLIQRGEVSVSPMRGARASEFWVDEDIVPCVTENPDERDRRYQVWMNRQTGRIHGSDGFGQLPPEQIT